MSKCFENSINYNRKYLDINSKDSNIIYNSSSDFKNQTFNESNNNLISKSRSTNKYNAKYHISNSSNKVFSSKNKNINRYDKLLDTCTNNNLNYTNIKNKNNNCIQSNFNKNNTIVKRRQKESNNITTTNKQDNTISLYVFYFKNKYTICLFKNNCLETSTFNLIEINIYTVCKQDILKALYILTNKNILINEAIISLEFNKVTEETILNILYKHNKCIKIKNINISFKSNYIKAYSILKDFIIKYSLKKDLTNINCLSDFQINILINEIVETFSYLELKTIIYVINSKLLSNTDNNNNNNNNNNQSNEYTDKNINQFKNKININNFVNLIFKRTVFEDYLFISNTTLKDFEIFNTCMHPSMVKRLGKEKEYYSLFSLFCNYITTNQGKKLLNSYFSFPLKNLSLINKRLECIDGYFMIDNNVAYLNQIKGLLKQVSDFEVILNSLNSLRIDSNLLKILLNSIYAALDIINVFKVNIFKNLSYNTIGKFNMLNDLIDNINFKDLAKINNFITNIIDLKYDNNANIKTNTNNMFNYKKLNIKIGINKDLDDVRNEYNNISNVLNNLTYTYFNNKQKSNSFMDLIYYSFIPQLGYMVGIRKNKDYYNFINTIYSNINDIIKTNNYSNIKYRVNNILFNYCKKESEANSDLSHINSKDTNKDLIDNKINNSYLNNNDNEQIIDLELINDNEEDNMLYYNFKNNLSNNLTLEVNNNTSKKNSLNLKNDNNNINDSNNKSSDIHNNYNDLNLDNNEETFILKNINFINISNLEFEFHTEDSLYFKSNECHQLDEKYGDLSARIVDIENSIFREIANQIKQKFSTELLNLNIFISTLDVSLCYYQVALNNNFTKPRFEYNKSINNLKLNQNNNIIEIKKLQNLFNEIDNSNIKTFDSKILISDKINIITDNDDYLSLTMLKRIGQIILLSHLGSYVPCEDMLLNCITNNNCLNSLLSYIDVKESQISNLSSFAREILLIKIIDNFNSTNNYDEQNITNNLVFINSPFKSTSDINKYGLYISLIQKYQKNNDKKLILTMNNYMYENDVKTVNTNKSFLELSNINIINIFKCIETSSDINNIYTYILSLNNKIGTESNYKRLLMLSYIYEINKNNLNNDNYMVIHNRIKDLKLRINTIQMMKFIENIKKAKEYTKSCILFS